MRNGKVGLLRRWKNRLSCGRYMRKCRKNNVWTGEDHLADAVEYFQQMCSEPYLLERIFVNNMWILG